MRSSRIETLAARLIAEIEGDEATFRPQRIHTVSSCVVRSAPWLGGRELLTLATLGLWICAFDDLADERIVGVAELDGRASQYLACARGRIPSIVARDPLARMMLDIGKSLRATDPDPILWRRWLAELRAMMAAMSWERRAVDGVVEPADYLRHAVDSIGVGVAALAAWMLMGGRGLPAQLMEMKERCALVVRLANDLQTIERERREGSPNILLFVTDRDEVVSRCRAELSKMTRTRSSRRAEFLHRFTQFFVDLYLGGHDLTDDRRGAHASMRASDVATVSASGRDSGAAARQRSTRAQRSAGTLGLR